MNLQTWQIVAGVFGSSGFGGAVSSGLVWLGKHQRSQAYTMGAVDHAVQTAMSSVTGQLDRTEKRLQAVEDQHEQCERNLVEVGRKLDAVTRDAAQERAELLSQIDRLMATGPAAPYTVITRPVPDRG